MLAAHEVQVNIHLQITNLIHPQIAIVKLSEVNGFVPATDSAAELT
jgi:hypothetical protein